MKTKRTHFTNAIINDEVFILTILKYSQTPVREQKSSITIYPHGQPSIMTQFNAHCNSIFVKQPPVKSSSTMKVMLVYR